MRGVTKHFGATIALENVDLTVLEGIRTIDGSLSECVACHANKHDGAAYTPVNGEDQFCAGCHEFTGVSLDCFQCHSTVPTE